MTEEDRKTNAKKTVSLIVEFPFYYFSINRFHQPRFLEPPEDASFSETSFEGDPAETEAATGAEVAGTLAEEEDGTATEFSSAEGLRD